MMLTVKKVASGVNGSLDGLEGLFVRSPLRRIAPRHAHATKGDSADLDVAGAAAKRDRGNGRGGHDLKRPTDREDVVWGKVGWR